MLSCDSAIKRKACVRLVCHMLSKEVEGEIRVKEMGRAQLARRLLRNSGNIGVMSCFSVLLIFLTHSGPGLGRGFKELKGGGAAARLLQGGRARVVIELHDPDSF